MNSEITKVSDHTLGMPRGVDRVAAADPFPLAGIWRRPLAAIIDVLILVAASYALALPFRHALYWLGPWGRLIGLVLGITYFGLTGSHLTRGQSLGMKLLRIGVVTRQAIPPDLPRSYARAAILCLIILGAAWMLPVPVLPAILGAISAIGLTLMIYGFFFNRSTGQGPHDLLSQTYVVRLPIYDQQAPRFSTIYLVGQIGCAGLAIFIALSAVLFSSQIARVFSPGTGNALRPLQTHLAADPRIFSVTTQNNISRRIVPGGRGEVTSTLILDVWAQPCGVVEADLCATIATDVARIVLQDEASLRGTDNLVITITQRADLGWAMLTTRSPFAHSIDTWRTIIGSP